MEYVTKWVEAYPGMGLLSDRGPNLLSEQILDVCEILGIKKINTTAYHPQTNGLVEKMSRTLRSMLAKHAHKFGPNWELHLQQFIVSNLRTPLERFPFILCMVETPDCQQSLPFLNP